MDEVTTSALKNYTLLGVDYNGERSDDLDQTLLYQTIIGNISSALGVTAIDLKSSSEGPLFTTMLDETDNIYTSIVSSVEAKPQSGVSPSFLKKIWCISGEEAEAVVNSNT